MQLVQQAEMRMAVRVPQQKVRRPAFHFPKAEKAF